MRAKRQSRLVAHIATPDLGEKNRTIASKLFAAISAVVISTVFAGHTMAQSRDHNNATSVYCAPAPMTRSVAAAYKQVLDQYSKLPIAFMENRGQTAKQVRFVAKGSHYAFFLTPQEVVLSLANGTHMRHAKGSSPPPICCR